MILPYQQSTDACGQYTDVGWITVCHQPCTSPDSCCPVDITCSQSAFPTLPCLIALSTAGQQLSSCVHRKPRQKRNAILFFSEAAVQCLNLLFYLLPNIYVLRQPCDQLAAFIFWSGWVRWSCWNTVRLNASASSHLSLTCCCLTWLCIAPICRSGHLTSMHITRAASLRPPSHPPWQCFNYMHPDVCIGIAAPYSDNDVW